MAMLAAMVRRFVLHQDRPARPVTPTNRRRDQLLAVALLVGACVTAPLFDWPTAGELSIWVLGAWALTLTAPLAFRRRFPLAVAVVVCAVFVAGQAAGIREHMVSQIAPFVALYTAGAWAVNRYRSVIVRVVLVVGLLTWLSTQVVALGGPLSSDLAAMPQLAVVALNVLANLLYLGAAIALGEVSWLAAVRLAALEARTAELQAERERTAAQAVALERVRIARELHDVVAHHVSVIGIQAGAARRVLGRAPGTPPRAEAALTAIEQNARHAVEELHHVLRALRSGDDGVEEPGPAHAVSTLGVDQIPALLAASQDAGTPARLQVLGLVRPLPPAVGLVLYRIAQEALTNVRKHAVPGAGADVRLVYQSDAVELSVEDSDGRRPVAPGAATGGLGQQGMRERAAAAGGAVHAGPTPHGYAVRASIPFSTVPA